MIKKKKILALIVAREYSKRLKKKNLLKLRNKTLIERTFDTARKSKYIDKIILSTESKKIIKTAKSFGLNTPCIRPKKLSKDNVGADKVVLHTIKKYKNDFFYIILLQPTSPMRTTRDIDACIEKIDKKKFKSIISIYKSNKLNKFKVIIKGSKIIKNDRSSKLSKKNYYINGAIYISNIKNYIKKKKFLSNETGFYLMPEKRSIDIDYKSDYIKVKRIYANV